MMDKEYLMNAISWSEGQLEPLMDPNSCSMDHFESMVSSPGLSNDAVALRELIGKLGGGSSFPPPSPYSNLISSTPLNKVNSVPSLSGDPGFAERAAKFSCFGSRSFNGRTGTALLNNPLRQQQQQQQIPRVSSTPCIVEIKKYCKGASSNEEESSVSEQVPSSNSRKRKVAVSRGKQSKGDGSNELLVKKDGNGKRCKPTERRDNEEEEEEETKGGSSSSNDESEKQKQQQQAPPIEKDYIHVRARRGQATDSHSLAERVRREKISERMKLLQDLVPGCNKVTGKALMLDEIINYVQSLQRQVEFLSMKLATVNPDLEDSSNMDNLLPKDMFQQNPNLPHQMYHLDSSSPVFYNHQNPVDPQQLEARNLGLQLPSLDGFNQFPTFGEDDLHSIVNQMAFGQHPVPHQACDMKVER